MRITSCESVDNLAVDRRRFLGRALGACAISPPLGFFVYAVCAKHEWVFDKRTTRQHDAVAGH